MELLLEGSNSVLKISEVLGLVHLELSSESLKLVVQLLDGITILLVETALEVTNLLVSVCLIINLHLVHVCVDLGEFRGGVLLVVVQLDLKCLQSLEDGTSIDISFNLDWFWSTECLESINLLSKLLDLTLAEREGLLKTLNTGSNTVVIVVEGLDLVKHLGKSILLRAILFFSTGVIETISCGSSHSPIS